MCKLKVAILAGGLGTRISEETSNKPKAMVKIGGQPILWHIMKYYSHFGFNEFVIALGYKGESITSWMLQQAPTSNIENVASKEAQTLEIVADSKSKQNWIVHLVDTGQNTMTGGRIKRLAHWLSDQTFMLTWCDGLADVNLDSLLRFHQSHRRLATVTAVRPPSRFGHLVLKGDKVVEFNEKPRVDWINGAFFVLEPEVIDYIKDDYTQWEKEPLEKLANEGQFMAFRHNGFWQCMDNLTEKRALEQLWRNGEAPWKKW